VGFIPVEILDRVGTGRGTIPASDTPVIDLCNQTLFIDISGIDRTDFRARGMIAVHARPWKQSGFDVRIFSLNIGDQFDPVDGTAFCGFFRPDDWDIIFRLTSHDTGCASRASIQIDHHSPSMHHSPLKIGIRIPDDQNSRLSI
jgi:hypothetical protein